MAHTLGSGHCCNPSDNFSVYYGWTEQLRPVNPKVEECVSWLTRNGVTPGISPLCHVSYSPHLEHLSIICRPFYLPREFSAIIVTSVYIPPQADTGLALSKLHDVLSGYINKHPDAALSSRGILTKPTSGRSCRTFTNMYPVQLEDRIHWIIATLSLRMPTKPRSLPAFGNRTMPPFSSHRNINKGSVRNPRCRE